METTLCAAPGSVLMTLGERADFRVGADALAVLHAGVDERARDGAIDVHARDHQRAEEIALAALVDAEVRLEFFRREHFLVAQFRLAENFRLQRELDEILRVLALDEHLRAFDVNGEVELALLRGVEGVGFLDELETHLGEAGAQLVGLCGGERGGKGGERWHRQGKRGRGRGLKEPENRAAFQSALTDWFARHGRDLPWRHTRDPYAVLVSEFMLQQTQVATVLDYYRRWLERFPTVAALADAPAEEVLRAWEGLGYYARARNLHRAAQIIRDEHGGEFPRELERIAALPGVGRYTAGAVASFAFDGVGAHRGCEHRARAGADHAPAHPHRHRAGPARVVGGGGGAAAGGKRAAV